MAVLKVGHVSLGLGVDGMSNHEQWPFNKPKLGSGAIRIDGKTALLLIDINGSMLPPWHLVMPPKFANLNFHKYVQLDLISSQCLGILPSHSGTLESGGGGGGMQLGVGPHSLEQVMVSPS